jgi:hypothetical protein
MLDKKNFFLSGVVGGGGEARNRNYKLKKKIASQCLFGLQNEKTLPNTTTNLWQTKIAFLKTPRVSAPKEAIIRPFRTETRSISICF